MPTSLLLLDLSHCSLPSLPASILPPALISLQLAGNPLHCSCPLSWLASLLPHILASSPEPVSRVRCREPEHLRDQDLLEVDFSHCGGGENNEIREEEEHWVFLATVIFAVMVVAMVVTVMLVMLIGRCCRSSTSTSSCHSSDYRSLPYPGDVRSRRQQEDGGSAASFPSSKPLLSCSSYSA